MTIVLGLTGGIGMGKSSVAGMLHDMNIPVFEADRYVHRLLRVRGAGVGAVTKAFPESYDRTRRAINRAKLGQIIFGSRPKRKKLESILHPLVRAAEVRFIAKHQRKGTKIIVLDIPLLFETKDNALCDAVVVVTAPRAVQRVRVLSRPDMTPERLKAILAAQMKDAQRCKRADFILNTNQDLSATARDLQTILRAVQKTIRV